MPTLIIRDTAGTLHAVRDTGDAALAHVWLGTPCKADGTPKAGQRERLVRKAGAVVVRGTV